MQIGYQAENDGGYQQITALSASTALTVPTGCTKVICTPETQAIRWRADGTDPTATVGYPLPVGAELTLTLGQLARVRFIEQTASAKLNIVYFK